MATWTIANLERNTADGGVVVAHWRVTEEETVGEHTYTASSYGTQGFSYDAADPDFVPYDQLTEADVLAWVWGAVDKDAIEAALAENIEDQKAPQTVSGTPW
jgi:hypothetical protein